MVEEIQVNWLRRLVGLVVAVLIWIASDVRFGCVSEGADGVVRDRFFMVEIGFQVRKPGEGVE